MHFPRLLAWIEKRSGFTGHRIGPPYLERLVLIAAEARECQIVDLSWPIQAAWDNVVNRQRIRRKAFLRAAVFATAFRFLGDLTPKLGLEYVQTLSGRRIPRWSINTGRLTPRNLARSTNAAIRPACN